MLKKVESFNFLLSPPTLKWPACCSKKPAAQLGAVSGRLDVNASPTRNGFVEAILTSSGRRISHLSADGLPSSFITRP